MWIIFQNHFCGSYRLIGSMTNRLIHSSIFKISIDMDMETCRIVSSLCGGDQFWKINDACKSLKCVRTQGHTTINKHLGWFGSSASLRGSSYFSLSHRWVFEENFGKSISSGRSLASGDSRHWMRVTQWLSRIPINAICYTHTRCRGEHTKRDESLAVIQRLVQ